MLSIFPRRIDSEFIAVAEWLQGKGGLTMKRSRARQLSEHHWILVSITT